MACTPWHAACSRVSSFSPFSFFPQVFATASTDTTIKVWDMRALSSSKGGAPKPLATGGHPQACQAALFAPDGALVLERAACGCVHGMFQHPVTPPSSPGLDMKSGLPVSSLLAYILADWIPVSHPQPPARLAPPGLHLV